MAMFSKGKSVDLGVISSVIGQDAQVKGEIVSGGAVRVDGEFEGKINAKGDVYVGEGSKVIGNIMGSRVVVSGEVSGNIITSNGLEITKTGRVFGDITGDKLFIDEGAIYKGKVSMEAPSKKGHSEAREPEIKPVKSA